MESIRRAERGRAVGFAGFPGFRAALREVVLSSPPHVRTPDRHDSSVIAIEQERTNLENLQRVSAATESTSDGSPD
jgi:DNA-binding MurR/RpiR family transcriptional regulator